MISIKIDNFEGPLDLLLHLIDNKKMSIKDISVSPIIDEYLEIINNYNKDNFKIKIEFLQMASVLIEIKAKSILKKEINDTVQEELEQKLVEYKLIKEMALEFSKKENENYNSYYKNTGKNFGDEIIEHNYEALNFENIKLCINSIYKKYIEANKQSLKINFEDDFTTEDATQIILSLNKKEKYNFSSLLGSKFSKNRIVSFFISILDLYKNNIINIEINEEEFFIIKE